MKRLTIFLGLLLASAPLWAQEEKQQENAEKEVQVAQAGRNGKDKKEAEKDADDYRPTEEISEDLSVSYPIDI